MLGKNITESICGIRMDRFFQGKRHAITMSYDDGREADRRLTELFRKSGIRGTFHLNSGMLGRPGYVAASELREVYRDHEIAGHSVHHPYLERLAPEIRMEEIWEDRKALETWSGQLVDGFSYPFGTWDERVIDTLHSCGFAYSRTVASTGRFDPPQDFMKWNPTCHHNDALLERTELFLERTEKEFSNMLFYVWGHSYEFDRDDNWDLIEEFCERVAGRENIWYASNGEIYHYLQAVKQLRFFADRSRVYNPSAQEVWFSVNGKSCSVKPGEYMELKDL